MFDAGAQPARFAVTHAPEAPTRSAEAPAIAGQVPHGGQRPAVRRRGKRIASSESIREMMRSRVPVPDPYLFGPQWAIDGYAPPASRPTGGPTDTARGLIPQVNWVLAEAPAA